MGVLASPILQLLFRDSSELAASMLQLGAVSIVFFSLSTLSNGLLQGINRMREPVKNALIALVLHIGLLVVLMYVFKLNIYAVVYANAFFGLLMCVLNAHSVKKYSGYRQESYQLALYLLRVNAIATVFSILIGVIVYAVVLLLLKGLTEEEILKFPKGAALVRLARKMHLLR